MPKNLSRVTVAPAIEQFYTPIHAAMTNAGNSVEGLRPTMAEFVDALRAFAIPSTGVALDAGSGGTATLAIACSDHGFRSVQAIDLNHDSLRLARTVIEEKHRWNVGLTCGSVLAMPFGDDAFDFAGCVGVAHHTPEPVKAVAELARVLKPGGKLYFSVYCFADSAFEAVVRMLRWVGARVPFQTMRAFFPKSLVWNNFVLDHTYVPILWLFRAEEVRKLLAQHHLSITGEWSSRMDPFAHWGRIGRWMSGDGLMRVWLCEKQQQTGPK